MKGKQVWIQSQWLKIVDKAHYSYHKLIYCSPFKSDWFSIRWLLCCLIVLLLSDLLNGQTVVFQISNLIIAFFHVYIKFVDSFNNSC